MRFGCTFGVVQSLGMEAGLERMAAAGYEGVELAANTLVTTDDGEPMAQCRPLRPGEVEASLPAFVSIGERVRGLNLELASMVFSYFWVGRFELPAMEDYFRLARAAGAPALKVAGTLIGGRPPDYWEALRGAQEQMETVCAFAEKHGVRALIELHDGYLHESASQARRLCEPFDPKWVGVIHDPENMIRSGKEHWPHSFDILGDYLAYVHWKNMGYRWDPDEKRWATFRTPLAEGLVDWRQIVAALHSRGFDGFMMNENGFLQDIRVLDDDLAYMRALLTEVSGPA